jgi:hypothetical protein
MAYSRRVSANRFEAIHLQLEQSVEQFVLEGSLPCCNPGFSGTFFTYHLPVAFFSSLFAPTVVLLALIGSCFSQISSGPRALRGGSYERVYERCYNRPGLGTWRGRWGLSYKLTQVGSGLASAYIQCIHFDFPVRLSTEPGSIQKETVQIIMCRDRNIWTRICSSQPAFMERMQCSSRAHRYTGDALRRSSRKDARPQCIAVSWASNGLHGCFIAFLLPRYECLTANGTDANLLLVPIARTPELLRDVAEKRVLR